MSVSLQLLKTEIHQFSRENWWIYIIFIVSIFIIFFTGKGNITEIIFMFSLNILGGLYVLLMQNSYSNMEFKAGAIFLMIANVLYASIALYSAFFNSEYQYLLWQVAFQISGLKIFFYYHKGEDWVWVNQASMIVLSIVLLFVGKYTLGLSMYQSVQSLGFGFVVVGLSQTLDIKRYFLIFTGNIFITGGALFGLYEGFLLGYIPGVTISYTILGISTFIFYLKLLPVYIAKLKNTT